MALDRRLTRVQYSGDIDAARGQLFGGMLVLNGVREQLRLSPMGLKQFSMVRHFMDGTVIQAVSSYGHEQINIYVPPRVPVVIPEVVEEIVEIHGFICHPRSDLFPGGRTPKGEQITPAYIYPLIDNDHGSVVLTPKWTLSTMVENYGNLEWLGSDGGVLSWRGPAGRQFPMDPRNNYAGFTVLDYTDVNENDFFTPYQNKSYKGGEVNLQFPSNSKVLGCSDRAIILNTDYSGVVNPDGGTNGFYTEVWVDAKTRIGYQPSSRASLPWFFSQSGSEAVSGTQRVVVAPDKKTVAFSSVSGGVGGSQSETISPSKTQWTLSRAGTWRMFYDYQKDILTGVELAVSQNQSSVLSGSSSQTYGDLPLRYPGTKATALIIVGPDAYGGPYAYHATPNGPGCEDSLITWSYPTGCGMGTISASRADGITGSKQVRMPTGVWTLISNEYFKIGQDNKWYSEIGGTKVEEWTVVGTCTTGDLCNGGTNDPAACTALGYGIPTLAPLIDHIVSVPCGGGNYVDLNYYNLLTTRLTYSWECP